MTRRLDTARRVLRADKEAWLRLAEKLTDGVKRRADGVLPLDEELRGLQSDPKVVFHLLPLPHTPVSTYHISGDGGDDSWPETKGKGKGKGKLKRKWKAPKNMPAPLAGKQSETKSGKPLCWNFNLEHGCKSGVAAGGKCDKGLHLCMEPGCQKPHPLHKHKSA